MKPTAFKKLSKARELKQILALIPKHIAKDPYWNLPKHLTYQYADMLLTIGHEHALAWTKTSAGHLLGTTDEQQRQLNPFKTGAD